MVVNVRPKQDRISVWTKTAANEALQVRGAGQACLGGDWGCWRARVAGCWRWGWVGGWGPAGRQRVMALSTAGQSGCVPGCLLPAPCPALSPFPLPSSSLTPCPAPSADEPGAAAEGDAADPRPVKDRIHGAQRRQAGRPPRQGAVHRLSSSTSMYSNRLRGARSGGNSNSVCPVRVCDVQQLCARTDVTLASSQSLWHATGALPLWQTGGCGVGEGCGLGASSLRGAAACAPRLAAAGTAAAGRRLDVLEGQLLHCGLPGSATLPVVCGRVCALWPLEKLPPLPCPLYSSDSSSSSTPHHTTAARQAESRKVQRQ